MNAVLRLNLLVSFVFAVALSITVYETLQQATKDISREVTAGLSFTHQLLSVAVSDKDLLDSLLEGEARHVKIELVDQLGGEYSGPDFDNKAEVADEDEEVPEWFMELIPGLDRLTEKEYYRYLPDGRALKLQADPTDEVEEVWESVQHVFFLFVLSAILSNLAIYVGVRQGIKPVSDFLAALGEIEKGRYTARLEKYSIKEINQLSDHFNSMAHSLEKAEGDNLKLTHELMRLQETERAHLARELHDDLGQYLTGIKAQAYLVKENSANTDLVASVGNQISINCDAMQTSFRQLIRELHPVILEQLGLLDAVRTQVDTWRQSHQVKVVLELPDFVPALDDATNTHIYRIVQESLNNIAQHAHAENVLLTMTLEGDVLRLRVADDGVGYVDTGSQGLGLRSMQERARCMSGDLVINKLKEKGSEVVLSVPLSVKEYENNYSG